MSEQLYLKSNAILEPLWNQWYAWPYLIQPATAACIAEKMHLRILESYVSAPHIHAAAAQSKKLQGGAFLDYDGPLESVADLIETTRRKLSKLIGLSTDIATLNTMLVNEAQGKSMEGLYEKVPESLRGLVELVYDLNHNPSFRFIESLLYSSELYSEEHQRIALTLADPDRRSFILSSPRFESENTVHLNLPFSHPLTSELMSMRHSPGSPARLEAIANHCGLKDAKRELFFSFFSNEEPALQDDRNFAGDGVRVRYFGHATVLIETRDVSVLIDPVISYHVEKGIGRFSYYDLPDKIDYVLLTHNHQDHVLFETLLQIRDKIGSIIVPKNSGGYLHDPSLKLILKNTGFKNIIELEEMERIPTTDGHIRALPFLGEHGDLSIKTKLAYQLELQGKKLLFAADSNNLEQTMYERVKEAIGTIDYVFIGMECAGAPMSWLYGALFNRPIKRSEDQSRRLNGSDHAKALSIVRLFEPKEAYVYAMGSEPWLTYISSVSYDDHSLPIVESDRFVACCIEKGIKCERLFGRFQFVAS